MKILAIETSCDETAVAIVENGTKILANIIASQINYHKPLGGVVPELASRMHCEAVHRLIEKALKTAQCSLDSISAIASTYGPGLEGALLVGLTAAKTMAYILKKPLIATHHLHGHIYANLLSEPDFCFPAICLIVSGGHTQLLKINDHFKIDILGQTRDDAAGEAFDKIARHLGLDYPGGPAIETCAKKGNPNTFNFPKAMLKVSYEFSFSGLKTAVIQTINKLRATNQPFKTEDICASFQKTVIDILIHKALSACQNTEIPTLLLSGGVIANKTLQARFKEAATQHNIRLITPPPVLCTDNAAMIASAAYYQYLAYGKSPYTTCVNPNAQITASPNQQTQTKKRSLAKAKKKPFAKVLANGF